MKLTDLKNKKILIVGGGVDGKATYRYLAHLLPDQVIHLVDKSDGSDYLDQQNDYDVVIKSPGIKPNVLHVPYTTSVNIFFANVIGTTIGITGTKGKSTTASLLYSILKTAGKRVHLVGNIGTPVLSGLELSNTPEDIWVCELSSYMTSDLAYVPDIAVILNIFPEHMDYHGTKENYYQAKFHLLAHAIVSTRFIYNPAYKELVALTRKTKATSIPFIQTLFLRKEEIPLLGEHNYDNVRAGITVAKLLHIDDEAILTGVKDFKPLKHRLENIGTYKGITFYDDAISTTPESTIEAIKTLRNIGTIFLGGQDRGYNFSLLVDKLLEEKIPNIILFSESGEHILQDLQKRNKKLPNFLQTDSQEEALKFTLVHAKPGTICLMSPASPSYTLWKNFTVRGDEFQQLVKKLGDKK